VDREVCVTQDGELLARLNELPWWREGTGNLRERYQAHSVTAKERASEYAERYAHRRAAMVLDVVLSRQRRYTRVEKLASEFAETPQGTSLEVLAAEGPGDGYPLRAGEATTMRAVAGGLLRYCGEHHLDEERGVRQWAREAGVFEHAPRMEPFVGTTPGIGPALFAYLRMRAGADALKPDLRVHTAFRALGYKVPNDPHAMLMVGRGAAEELGIGLLVLDQLLWFAS
jgi:hypothetical protein